MRYQQAPCSAGEENPCRFTTSEIGQELGRALERASPAQQVLTQVLTA